MSQNATDQSAAGKISTAPDEFWDAINGTGRYLDKSNKSVRHSRSPHAQSASSPTRGWLILYRTLIVLSALLITSALVGALALFIRQYSVDQAQEEQAQQALAEQDRLAARRRSKYIQDARAYNKRLFERPHAIGAIVDPFSGKQGNFKGSDDPEYNRLLSFPNGIMATLEIPRIHLRLPVRHGATPQVLEEGLGHLPGTSLPVGGKNSRAVITGHRGLVGATLFTRLPEVQPGDLFFITVYGETFAYRVVSQKVVLPDNTNALKIVPGRDLVTLLTCTPYGVNDHRLLVTGERTKWPLTKPAPAVMWPSVSQIVITTLIVTGLVWLLLFLFRHRDLIGHHILRTIVKPYALRKKKFRRIGATPVGRAALEIQPGLPRKDRVSRRGDVKQ
jgi:sortase A